MLQSYPNHFKKDPRHTPPLYPKNGWNSRMHEAAFLPSISPSAWSLWALVHSHFQFELSGEAAAVGISIGYWLLQFELTLLPHLDWAQLGASGLHINQSLPKVTLHREPNSYISSVRIGFLSLFLSTQYTYNPGYNNKDKNNYQRLLNG